MSKITQWIIVILITILVILNAISLKQVVELKNELKNDTNLTHSRLNAIQNKILDSKDVLNDIKGNTNYIQYIDTTLNNMNK